MRYFIGFLVTIGLIIVLIVLLFTGGNDNKSGSSQLPKRPTEMTLPDYASSDAVTRLVIDGTINADQDHQAVRISVTKEDVTYEQIQGYQGTVVNKQVYANNQSAYSNFLSALNDVGFTKGDSGDSSEKGRCPLGSRYTFEVFDSSQSFERYWATSCGNPKTYKGNLSKTLDLFEAQVPDYQSLTDNLDDL